MCKIRGFFSKSERKKKPIHVPIVKKVHRLQGSQYALLDHSKSLILVTLSKNKFFPNIRALEPFVLILRAPKKLFRATLKESMATSKESDQPQNENFPEEGKLTL